MYLYPGLKSGTNTPSEYTDRARDEVIRKLNIKPANSQATATALKHGSSPLKMVSNASDSSLTKTNSNDSVGSVSSSATTETKKHRNLFGLLKSKKQQKQHQDPEGDVAMEDPATADTTQYASLQPLHPVPSITSTISQYSNQSSLLSRGTAQDSLFSRQYSLATQPTNLSDISSINTQPVQDGEIRQQPNQKRLLITLQEALPTDFSDIYAPELLADPNLLIGGRPIFTKRALLDWDLNDIRSLLIVDRLKPEWNNQLPIIFSPQGFRFLYLPLDADDETIIQTLVDSDIYKEANFDTNFRIQTAKYTLNTARTRHAMVLKNSGLPTTYNTRLSKPEWRNVIENFLLNLAVEAQCRYDFKKLCHEYKKRERAQSESSSSSASISLLKKAILNDVSQTKQIPSAHIKLSKETKAQLWTQVQSKVYQRLGLDWAPDKFS